MVRVCDGRMSGTASGTVVLHVAPEAAAGGPLALVRTGDRIRIDAAKGTLNLLVEKAEIKRRKPKPPRRMVSGVLEKYAAQVGPANLGAVTHSGPKGRRGP
jgi:dihydroxy-acid dehydratase